MYDIVLLIIPRTLLAAEYASWHCLDGLRSALSCTPKPFSALTDSIVDGHPRSIAGRSYDSFFERVLRRAHTGVLYRVAALNLMTG